MSCSLDESFEEHSEAEKMEESGARIGEDSLTNSSESDLQKGEGVEIKKKLNSSQRRQKPNHYLKVRG